MMDHPLTVRSIYQRARALFPDKPLVTRRPEGVRRTTYGEWAERVARLAGGLRDLGVGPGDRVATFCWNSDRHLEVYFAAALMGASYHTLNIRLGGDQLAYIVNHARDKVLICDAELASAIGPVLPSLDTVEQLLLLDGAEGERPSLGFPAEHGYEDLVERSAPMTDWPALDEGQTAGICYTSATTGNPKGVAYSHRALYLHSLMVGLVDTAAICERDVLLPIVPMFHVNAWGMPFAATWYGAGQVYGGPAPTPADYLRLIRTEGVTVSAGVPTVWLGVLQLLEADGGDLGSLQRIICGGSAAPVSMIRAYEERHGVEFIHAYGMTEATPVTHFSRLKSTMGDLPVGARYGYKARQGLLVPGLEQRLVDGDGDEVPADGKSVAPRSPPSTSTTRARPRPSSTAGTTPGTWPPSTARATCTWWTGPETWSSPAASGSPASSWRTPSWATPRSPRRRSSPSPTSAGANVRWPWSSASRARRSARPRWSPRWPASSPGGGCPSGSSSSTRSP
jgi:fatty-acyl-CoA synthase